MEQFIKWNIFRNGTHLEMERIWKWNAFIEWNTFGNGTHLLNGTHLEMERI